MRGGVLVSLPTADTEADEEATPRQAAAKAKAARGNAALTGFVQTSQLKDFQTGSKQKAEEVLKRIHTGQPIQLVTTDVNWLDGRMLASAKPSTLAQKRLTFDDLHAGDVLPANVVRIEPSGLRLQLGGKAGVVGKVRPEHMVDAQLAKPHSKFKKGEAAECLVLQVQPPARAGDTGRELLTSSPIPIPALAPALSLSLAPARAPAPALALALALALVQAQAPALLCGRSSPPRPSCCSR